MNAKRTGNENTVQGRDIQKLIERGRTLHSQAIGHAFMRLFASFRRRTEQREQLPGKHHLSYT